MESEDLLMISKEEYEKVKKVLENITKLRESRNKWTKTYINKPENKEKLKEKRKEYAKKNYEKNKTNEEFMNNKREKALANYYKNKDLKKLI